MSKHLDQTGEGYWSHFKFGVVHGLYLFKMGIMSIVHAIFPDIYPFELPRMVIFLHEKIKRKHGAKLVRELTHEVKEKYFKNDNS